MKKVNPSYRNHSLFLRSARFGLVFLLLMATVLSLGAVTQNPQPERYTMEQIASMVKNNPGKVEKLFSAEPSTDGNANTKSYRTIEISGIVTSDMPLFLMPKSEAISRPVDNYPANSDFGECSFCRLKDNDVVLIATLNEKSKQEFSHYKIGDEIIISCKPVMMKKVNCDNHGHPVKNVYYLSAMDASILPAPNASS